jgi:hypothetical protein
MKLTRRKFVKGAAAGASLFFGRLSSVGKMHSAHSSAAPPKTSRPNVVFILADDLGWVISVATVGPTTAPQISISWLPRARSLLMLILHPLFALRRAAASSLADIPRALKLG